MVFFYSFTCVTVRRLHDSGRTGWWLITTPIPILNFVLPFFLIQEGESNKNRFGSVPDNLPIDASLLEILYAIPDNISMALRSAWKGRERVLAVFAGVFLASLVITTVLAYSAGLNGAFLQFSLQEEIFDGKVDFAEDPDRTLKAELMTHYSGKQHALNSFKWRKYPIAGWYLVDRELESTGFLMMVL